MNCLILSIKLDEWIQWESFPSIEHHYFHVQYKCSIHSSEHSIRMLNISFQQEHQLFVASFSYFWFKKLKKTRRWISIEFLLSSMSFRVSFVIFSWKNHRLMPIEVKINDSYSNICSIQMKQFVICNFVSVPTKHASICSVFLVPI